MSSVVEPSWKPTVPVGVPAPGAATPTLAVNVTDWPKTADVGLTLSVVFVPGRLTIALAVA